MPMAEQMKSAVDSPHPAGIAIQSRSANKTSQVSDGFNFTIEHDAESLTRLHFEPVVYVRAATSQQLPKARSGVCHEEE